VAKFSCYRLANLRGHAREQEEERKEGKKRGKRREIHFPQSMTNLYLPTSLNPPCFVDVWETEVPTVRRHGKQADALL